MADKRPVFERKSAAARHADEETLLAYADGDLELAPAERAHIASCAICTSRAFELRRMRRLLEATAVQAEAAPRDVAQGAMNRVRHRRAAIGHVNELFGALAALLRGFSTLLSSRDKSTRG